MGQTMSARGRADLMPEEPLGVVRALLALIGAAFIRVLIRILGQTLPASSAPWLFGPIGNDYIGDRPYEEVAARENLQLIRRASSGGLLADVSALNGPGFDVARLRSEVRHFYEHTAAYRMTSGPTRSSLERSACGSW